MFSYFFKPTSLSEALIRDTLAKWLKKIGHQTDMPLADEMPQILAAIQPHHIPQLEGHAVFKELICENILKEALTRETPDLICALTCSDTFMSIASLKRSFTHVLKSKTSHQKEASLLLATLADTHIACEKWKSYANGIATAMILGHSGTVAWAEKMDLPVFDCLPIQEAFNRAYGQIPSDGVFLYMAALANAQTAHEKLRLRRINKLAGETAEECLFNISPAFENACAALPSLDEIKRKYAS
jgi:hypothetical protein